MFKKPITLGSATSVQEVFSWANGDSPLALRLSNDSEFAPFAQGVAIGVLRQLHVLGRPLSIHTTVEHPQQSVGLKDFAPLKSLFGLAAIYQAEQVLNFQKRDIRKEAIAQNWSEVQQFQGHLGNAKRRYIVFRDPDYSIPQCLRDSAKKTFPEANQFAPQIAVSCY
jgi:hypothetical protein